MFKEEKLATDHGVSATISIKDWLLLDIIQVLNIIPFVGSIAVIVIYLIIAFSSSTAISLKNRVLATLIWMAIWIVLGLIAFFVLGGIAGITALMGRM